jgi:oligoendopeptidase F
MPNSTTTQPLPKRHELPEELTWDLSLVYKSEDEWEKDFARVEALLPFYEAACGTIDESPQQLLKVLRHRDESGILFYQLRSWASLKKAEDNGSSEAQARLDRADMLGTRRYAATAWIEPQIIGMPAEKLQEFIAAESGLREYSYYFETLERRRAHIRSADVEDVLAQAGDALDTPSGVFSLFNNADIKFPKVKDENGEEVELTKGRYIQFLESHNRQVREDAFCTMHGEYSKWRNTLAATLSGAVKTNVFAAKVRRYESALDAALQPDAIPTSVYHNLIATTRERLPVLHRYFRLRKKLLKLDELRLWDLYVPMIEAVDSQVNYDQARKDVLAAAAPMGSDYITTVQRAFDERWIDVPENEGKTSGAFSDGAYTTPPYVLLNWQNKTNDAFTLAHELGHSLHSHYTRTTQPFIYSGYTIFVAEVASTLYEALLAHHLIEQAKANNDRATQLYLLNEEAEKFRTTLYRQTMFAEFELGIHQTVERGEALTADGMSAQYLQLNKDYYGAEVNVDDTVQIEWARIPHFYYGYYVYQYATGISASAALSKQILSEGQPAVERYLNFLRGGGSDTSINLLKGAGVDMTTPDPINLALDRFDEVIAQMEELAE